MYLSTAKSAAKIATEQSQSDCDIVVGLEGAYMEKIKEHLASVEKVRVQDYVEGMKPSDFDHRYVIWERQAGSIVMNDAVMEKFDKLMNKNTDEKSDKVTSSTDDGKVVVKDTADKNSTNAPTNETTQNTPVDVTQELV